MKTKTVLAGVVACTLGALVPFAAMSDPTAGMSPVETKVVIQDSAITSSVKAQLKADHAAAFADVDVDADDHGIVTLDGHVRTQDEADRAISIAKHTDGVREVRSQLKIEKGG